MAAKDAIVVVVQEKLEGQLRKRAASGEREEQVPAASFMQSSSGCGCDFSGLHRLAVVCTTCPNG